MISLLAKASASRVPVNAQNPQQKLDQIVEEFAELEPRERLELLLEFAEGLPPLPTQYEQQRQAGQNRVHECMTPVFLWVEMENGLVRMHGWVAPEAPTVQGFLAVLLQAFSGAPAEEVVKVPPTLVQRLGLTEALGMQRMRGLQAILLHVREKVRRAAALPSPQ
jgi:cysteine desulfuration protein SufE